MESLPEVQQRRLVIAIDYGTTYTGVAWATPASNRASLDEIEVVQDWGDRMGNIDKVPSVISYSGKRERSQQQWGSDLSQDAVAMVHTKLQLDVTDTSAELEQILEALEGMHNLDFQYIETSAGLPKYTRKGPEEIVTDYLQRVFEYLIEAVQSFTTELRTRIPVDIVVTIPAEWGYRAKNSTFRALRKAGFNDESFPQLNKMLLISEPEAAAIFTARHLKETMGRDFLKLNECFVLCDAGGGTVDVVSYRVRQLEPFEIVPIGVPIGQKCGAIFINLAFKEWLRNLIEPHRYQELDQERISHKISSHDREGPRMRTLMKNFEIKKKLFSPDSGDIYIDLPEPFRNLNLDTRVMGGQITISHEEMQSFFEPRATEIVKLIHDQLEQIESRGNRLKNVFLVGGFAESPYLQASIRESLSLLPVSVELRVPTEYSWTAVVRGAAIFGIEKSTNTSIPTMSACPRSYGVCVNAPFSDVENDPRDRSMDPLLKIDLAQGQFVWLMKKGDLILSDDFREATSPFERIIVESGSKTGSIQLYAYDHDDLPHRYYNSRNEVEQIGVLEYDLSNIPLQEFQYCQSVGGGRPYYNALLNLEMRIAPQFLRVQLCLKDRVISSMRIPDPLLNDLVTLDLV